MRSRQRGITVVELVVATVVTIMIVLGVIPLLVYLFGAGYSSISSTSHSTSLYAAIRILNSDLEITKTFLDRSYVGSASHTPVPADGVWKFEHPSQARPTLILQIPATTLPYQDPARKMVYNAMSGDCGGGAQPLYLNVVYYVDGDTLYRRVLRPPSTIASPCSGQTIHQVATCRSGCAQADIRVLKGLENDGFKVDYFTSPAAPTSTTGIWSTGGTGALKEQLAVKVTLTTKAAGGETAEQSASTRVSLAW